MALACLREGYPLDIPENLRDIPLSSAAFLLFSTDIRTNILRAWLHGNVWVASNAT